MHALLIGNNVEHVLLGASERPAPPGMEKLPGRDRHEAVGVEVVLFEMEGAIVPVEVTGAVVSDPMTKDQVLSAGRRSNGVGLNEPPPANSPARGGLRK